MTRTPKLAIRSLWAALVLAIPASAQGVELDGGAVVYFGSASRTTAPATIDYESVRAETPEWDAIVSEGIRKGSGRYQLLVAKMDKRIRAAVRAAVADSNNDLVVREGDIADAHGKQVDDLTEQVTDELANGVEEFAALVSGPATA